MKTHLDYFELALVLIKIHSKQEGDSYSIIHLGQDRFVIDFNEGGDCFDGLTQKKGYTARQLVAFLLECIKESCIKDDKFSITDLLNPKQRTIDEVMDEILSN
jgi:hypothetical protein